MLKSASFSPFLHISTVCFSFFDNAKRVAWPGLRCFGHGRTSGDGQAAAMPGPGRGVVSKDQAVELGAGGALDFGDKICVQIGQ